MLITSSLICLRNWPGACGDVWDQQLRLPPYLPDVSLSGGSCFGGNTLLALAGLLLAGQLSNAGAAPAPALALAYMGTGGILVVGAALAQQQGMAGHWKL